MFMVQAHAVQGVRAGLGNIKRIPACSKWDRHVLQILQNKDGYWQISDNYGWWQPLSLRRCCRRGDLRPYQQNRVRLVIREVRRGSQWSSETKIGRFWPLTIALAKHVQSATWPAICLIPLEDGETYWYIWQKKEIMDPNCAQGGFRRMQNLFILFQ